MHNPNKQNETLKQQLLTAAMISAVGGAATALFKLDQYLGTRDLVNEEPLEPEIIFSHRPNATKALVLMGGLCMGIQGVAKRYESQLSRDVNLIAPVSPDTGFNPKAMFEKTYQKLEETNPDEIVLAGLSMGGKLGLDWVNYGWKTGRQDLLQNYSMVFRGSPMDKSAIRAKPRFLLNAVGTLGYSYALDHSRPFLSRFDIKSAMTAPRTRVVPECKYLLGQYPDSLPLLPKRVVWVLGTQPDPVINEQRSVAVLQQKYGLDVEQVIDEECLDTKHMPTDKRAARFMLSLMDIAKGQLRKEPVIDPAWSQYEFLQAS